jgi:hypothetical protein
VAQVLGQPRPPWHRRHTQAHRAGRAITSVGR